jgi:8-oxo-dGTP pyrophosphatase MutT (NUDIX family)
VLEETGITIEVEDLISIRSIGPVTYPNGDITLFVDHFFRCRPISGTAHVGDDESLAVGWFDPADLPAPMMTSTPRLLVSAAEHARTGRTQFAR